MCWHEGRALGQWCGMVSASRHTGSLRWRAGIMAQVAAAVQRGRGCAEVEARDNGGVEMVAAVVRRSGTGELRRLGHGVREAR